MKTISVIMPVYNIEKYLKKSVESVLSQTVNDYEIILVNDGSTDGCPKICDELAELDERIKVIHKENEGSGYARQSGLDIATGKYIYFMDPDDYIDSNLFEDNIKLLEETDSDFVLFGHFDEVWDNEDKSIIKQTSLTPVLDGVYEYDEWISSFYDYLQMTPWTLWAHIYKRDYLINSGVRFTNQRVGQDAIYHLELFAKPFTRCVFNKKIYYHYVVKEGSAVSKFHINRFECELNIARLADKLFQNLGLDDIKYRDWITLRYVNAVLLEVNNLCKNACPMSNKEKVARLRSITNHSDMAEYIKTVPYNTVDGAFKKLKLFMLKNKMYNLLLASRRLKER